MSKSIKKLTDYAPKNTKAKSAVQESIDYLSRTTRRHKFNYGQLRFIFRSVRLRCDLKAPAQGRKLIELPTEEELKRFYGAISNPVHTLIFETLEGTGLRVSELCSLKVTHIDFDAQTVFVKNGKGGKDRVTVIGTYLCKKLKIYLHKKNNTYLFESQRYGPFSSRRIQQLCSKYKKDAKIEKPLTVHRFRHLWNSRLASNNISREVREILAGHAKGSKSQDIYTHLSVGGFKEAILKALDRGGESE